ncbi:hypothetical protein ACMFMG_009641 [Clarireedia jacksonii]
MRLKLVEEPSLSTKHLALPIGLGEFFTEPNNKVEQLHEAHPWLRELDKAEGADLSYVRKAYLADGHSFLSFPWYELEYADVSHHHLSNIRRDIYSIAFLRSEDMKFGDFEKYVVPGPHWIRIGKNLKPIFSILKELINKEGLVATIMLSRIDEQNATMRRQRQVITALQFRHLLEHLPKPLRNSKVDTSKSKEAASKIQEWDRMSEKERWAEFWEAAVGQVYNVYIEHGSATWTPEPANGKEFKPSPFAELLERDLKKRLGVDMDQSGKKKDRARDNDVKWLAHESNVGRQMKEIYSMLSQVIHQFSDGKYTVDPLTFSLGDARILAVLTPIQSAEESVDWKKEFRRYVWEQDTTACSEKSGKGKANVSNKAVEMNIPNEQSIDLEKKWRSLHAESPLAALFSGNLKDSSIVRNSTNPTLKFIYRPATTHLNSNSQLHGVVLAALVDLIGHEVILAAGELVTGGRVESKYTTSQAVRTSEQIIVSVTASKLGKKVIEQHWSVEVEMKNDEGVLIASGHFKAWGYKPLPATETNEGRA